MLNPSGPFVLLNPIRELAAGETRVLALSFSPQETVPVSPSPTRARAAALGPTATLHCSPPCTQAHG